MEIKHGTYQDDLSEFNDYISEFDSIINFDSENCPICGIEIPENVSTPNSTFILYKSPKTESDLQSLIKELSEKEIPSKIIKRLNTEKIDEISYVFDVMIPLKYLSLLEKIINK